MCLQETRKPQLMLRLSGPGARHAHADTSLVSVMKDGDQNMSMSPHTMSSMRYDVMGDGRVRQLGRASRAMFEV